MFVNTQSAHAVRRREDQLRQCPRLMATDDSHTINKSLLPAGLLRCLQESRPIVSPSMLNQTNNLFKTRHAFWLHTPDKGSQYEVQLSRKFLHCWLENKTACRHPRIYYLVYCFNSCTVKMFNKSRNECHPLCCEP